MASEVGVLDVPAAKIVEKGRLQPGKIFLIDTDKGRIVRDEELKAELAAERPYREWLDGNCSTRRRRDRGPERIDERPCDNASRRSATPTKN